MDFYSYFGEWMSKAFAFPWNLVGFISFIITIIGGFLSLKKPSWSIRLRLWIWLTPLLILCVVFIPSALIASYNMYYELLSDSVNRVNVLEHQIIILRKGQAIPWNAQLPVQSNNVDISLSAATPKISDRIFNNCNFFGDQSYIHMANCTIVKSSIKGTSKFVVLSINAMPDRTVVEFNNCVMQDCWLCDINIIGTEQEIAEYKRSFNIK